MKSLSFLFYCSATHAYILICLQKLLNLIDLIPSHKMYIYRLSCLLHINFYPAMLSTSSVRPTWNSIMFTCTSTSKRSAAAGLMNVIQFKIYRCHVAHIYIDQIIYYYCCFACVFYTSSRLLIVFNERNQFVPLTLTFSVQCLQEMSMRVVFYVY